MTSGIIAKGRFGKQGFRYVEEEVSTSVRPVKGSFTTTPTKSMAWFCAATGPTLAKAAPSNRPAPAARSDASLAGSMSIFSKRCSAGSMSTPRRCARARDGRASVRYNQGSNGCHPLPDEDAAPSSRRDGVACTRLQHDAGNEHYGRPTAPGSDEGIAAANKASICCFSVGQRPRCSQIRFQPQNLRKHNNCRGANRHCSGRGVLTRPRPKAEVAPRSPNTAVAKRRLCDT
jgi:hypothetical protein